MQIDSSNNIRVDLQDIYNSCEEQTAYHSRMINNNEEHQRIIICPDDYRLIHPWAMEAASLIADSCNYISNAGQTGLEAISNPFAAGQTNPNDSKSPSDLMQNEKQTGEYLSKEEMDEIEFNVEQMFDLSPLKYTVIQTYIRAAIIEYVLYKWYELNRLTDSMSMKYRGFEEWVSKLENNSLNNQKVIKTRRPYRIF